MKLWEEKLRDLISLDEPNGKIVPGSKVSCKGSTSDIFGIVIASQDSDNVVVLWSGDHVRDLDNLFAKRIAEQIRDVVDAEIIEMMRNQEKLDRTA